jgi:hypothetical protein
MMQRSRYGEQVSRGLKGNFELYIRSDGTRNPKEVTELKIKRYGIEKREF